MLISGILFVYVIGSLTTVFWMNIICAMVPLVFGVIFFFMPESPVYLIIENRENDATESYKCLRGKHYNPIFELEQLKHEISQSKIQDLSLREAFRKPSNRRAIIIGFSLMLFMQMSGVNVVIFFSTTIFEVSAQFYFYHNLI